MKPASQLKIAASAVCLYAAWESRDLLAAWLHSPFDRLDFFAFLIWMAPLGFSLAREAHKADNAYHVHPADAGPGWLCSALGLSLAGVVLDMNVFKDAGLAVALAAFLPAIAPRPRRAARALWLCGAVSWMPALGWALNSRGPFAVNALRIGLALGASLFLCRPTRYSPRRPASPNASDRMVHLPVIRR